MHKKLILALIGLVLLIGGGTTGAEERRDNVKMKASVSPKKCWKRTSWVSSTTSMGDGTRAPIYERSDLPVCKAFEEVLNTTCEPPEKLRCNWTLPLGEKRFEKLRWKPLDWKEYWGFIKDSRVSGIREDLRENLWKTEEYKERKGFEEGHRSLSMTIADIDHDDNMEQMLRVDLLPCSETPGAIFSVMNLETKRLDWRFRQLLLAPNSDQGAEIMLYNSKAYMFGWDDAFKILMVYEGFYTNAVNARGYQNICQFKYIKGDKP